MNIKEISDAIRFANCSNVVRISNENDIIVLYKKGRDYCIDEYIASRRIYTKTCKREDVVSILSNFPMSAITISSPKRYNFDN